MDGILAGDVKCVEELYWMGTKRGGGRTEWYMRERISGMNDGKAEKVAVGGGGFEISFEVGDRGLIGGVGGNQFVWTSLLVGNSEAALLSAIAEVESGNSAAEYGMYVLSDLGNGTHIGGKIHWLDI